VFILGFAIITPFMATGGDGTSDSPYHLSAGNTGVQPINISLKEWRATNDPVDHAAPSLTIVSVQIAGGQTIFHLLWQGADISQDFNQYTYFSPLGGQQYSPISDTTSDVMTFAATPQAGQQWVLNVGIIGPPDPDNRSGDYDYDDLYLQF
jgi:hypothetical protein